ncbi:MAG: MBL fold metallo-hydrolase [Gemmatimonas sp. SM23_52]|nr:MAG: MBL fold metallo-hydrolase [Gemmatimonas sp. SM23_52]
MKLSVRVCLVALALSAAALAVVPRVHAQAMEDVQIETVEVAPGVYMLVGRGGNIGVSVGVDGVFLVDDQYAPLTEKIVAAIRAISDGPIRFVLNTHWHGDHVDGNENLAAAGVLILAHDNVRTRMSEEQYMEAFDRRVPPAPEGALPVVTFSEALTFHLNGDEIHISHLENAHTDGDVIVRFRAANVVHMGDIYFAGGYPFIDVSAGGCIDGMIAAVETVLELVDDDTRIIPGHGPLSNKAELQEYHDMLVGVRDAVAEQIATGKDRDAVIAAKPTAPFDQKWGGAFLDADRFTAIVYSDLARRM